MLKEKAQGQQPEAESTNALIRVGLLHSSDEGPVMGLERREQVIEIALGQPKGRSLTMQWGDGIPRDGTSRKMREYHIRFCERLRVKFPGPTRPNASEPLTTHRNTFDYVKTGVAQGLREEHGLTPIYRPCGVRCSGGVTFIRAFVQNR